jgi:hypothetical protein
LAGVVQREIHITGNDSILGFATNGATGTKRNSGENRERTGAIALLKQRKSGGADWGNISRRLRVGLTCGTPAEFVWSKKFRLKPKQDAGVVEQGRGENVYCVIEEEQC